MLGFAPDVVIEPTCGVGAFVLTAAQQFPRAEVHGYEINPAYLDELRQSVERLGVTRRVNLHQQDFFETDWLAELEAMPGNVLVLGNRRVTNAGQGAIGGTNLPQKSNFRKPQRLRRHHR